MFSDASTESLASTDTFMNFDQNRKFGGQRKTSVVSPEKPRRKSRKVERETMKVKIVYFGDIRVWRSEAKRSYAGLKNFAQKNFQFVPEFFWYTDTLGGVHTIASDDELIFAVDLATSSKWRSLKIIVAQQSEFKLKRIRSSKRKPSEETYIDPCAKINAKRRRRALYQKENHHFFFGVMKSMNGPNAEFTVSVLFNHRMYRGTRVYYSKKIAAKRADDLLLELSKGRIEMYRLNFKERRHLYRHRVLKVTEEMLAEYPTYQIPSTNHYLTEYRGVGKLYDHWRVIDKEDGVLPVGNFSNPEDAACCWDDVMRKSGKGLSQCNAWKRTDFWTGVWYEQKQWRAVGEIDGVRVDLGLYASEPKANQAFADNFGVSTLEEDFFEPALAHPTVRMGSKS